MKRITRIALWATSLATIASSAQAQVNLVGTTSGCFYTTVGTCLANPYNGLMFTGGSFSLTPAAAGTNYDLNTLSDYLGTFTMAPNTNFNFHQPLHFRLSIMFTSPASASPNPSSFVAEFDGTTNINDNGDQLDINFDNNYATIDYAGAGNSWFKIRVNDVANLERDDLDGQLLTGHVMCTDVLASLPVNSCAPSSEGVVTEAAIVTPEPSTYALMAAGLAVLGFVSRRRRTNS